MAKVNWKVASNRRVVGDWVDVTCLEGIEARIKPRKYSQAGADEINAWAVSRAKFKKDVAGAKNAEEQIEKLSAADPEMIRQSGYMGMVLRYGIDSYQFGDEEGQPTDAWIKDVLDDVELASELLAIAQEFNGPLAKTTSDISATSPAGSSKE